MRVLFTMQSSLGHFHPLVPLARALRAAGHMVAFAASGSFAPTVEALGFRCFPAGFDRRDIPWPRLVPAMAGLGGEALDVFIEVRLFAGFRAQMAVPDYVAIARDWRPDVIVREASEYGGCVAAEQLGLPHAVVGVGSYRGPDWQRAGRVRQLDRLRRARGLPPDPELAMLARYLYLSFAPPSFADPAAPLPPTAHALRHVGFDQSGDERLPGWAGHLAGRPTVYATLGTVYNRRTDLLAAILAGLRDEPINLILTVGRAQDPAQFGPQPGHVRVERYIPQTLILPRCDLVLTHGGWNTTLAALAAGLPLVMLPISADQPDNAARCAALGAAAVIGPDGRTAGAIRAAVRTVLAEPAYRTNAARVRDENAALPGLGRAVALLERLAREPQPIPTA
jgi:UDP:flavonoid glycosyltransferase YjiC (YdhE family)